MLQDAVHIGQNLVVPEADHSPALAFEPDSAFEVLWIVRVLPAIELDDYLSFDAGEIGDVPSDRMLATEFEPVELPIPNTEPKTLFSLRQIQAQLPRPLAGEGGG